MIRLYMLKKKEGREEGGDYSRIRVAIEEKERQADHFESEGSNLGASAESTALGKTRERGEKEGGSPSPDLAFSGKGRSTTKIASSAATNGDERENRGQGIMSKLAAVTRA